MDVSESTQLDIRKKKLEAELITIRETILKGKYSKESIIAICLLIIIFSVIMFFAIAGGVIPPFVLSDDDWKLFVYGVIVFSIVMFVFLPGVALRETKTREQVLMGELALLGAESLQATIDEDFFTNLVKINFKYIDKYYLQTQIQAQNSFNISLGCALLSFLIIVIGIILMYFDKTTSAYIATGSGILSEFIAAVFFYLYNKTVLKMGEYHQKLVLTQNVSLALKIVEEMTGQEKISSQQRLVEELTRDVNQYLIKK